MNTPHAPPTSVMISASNFCLSRNSPNTPVMIMPSGAPKMTYNCPTVASRLPHPGCKTKRNSTTPRPVARNIAAILP